MRQLYLLMASGVTIATSTNVDVEDEINCVDFVHGK
jgi:hypothetical protein